LSINFVIEEEECGIENKLGSINEFFFRKDNVVRDVGPSFRISLVPNPVERL